VRRAIKTSVATVAPTTAAGGLPSVDSFEALVRWRRDVRAFKPDPVTPALLARLIEVADKAPSVGNSQPWRVVDVRSPALRAQVRANFEAANQAAAQRYRDEQRTLYDSLKLAGFDQAPVHLAVFCDPDPVAGHGLGRQTQPETLDHSCAGFITLLWLAARTHGVGLGWVSIIDPCAVTALLEVAPTWRLIGYLLMGYPAAEHDVPELVRHGWQPPSPVATRCLVR
jgi:5,6-dimethylbenzimidazole synthase